MSTLLPHPQNQVDAMQQIDDWQKLLSVTKGVIDEHIGKVRVLLEDSKLKSLAKDYQQQKAQAEQDPFNIILSSSDRYYYENLHSEILAALLRRSDFRYRFIDWLNTLRTNGGRVLGSHYTNFKVVVEESRIDVLLKSGSTAHCIIIENKINNAPDQRRQLPQYTESQKRQGHIIDGILYLSIDGIKMPNEYGWEPEDKHLVEPLLIRAAASNKTNFDMVSGFLQKCITGRTTLQEYAFISQYIDLLKYLGRMQMDEYLMKQFYEKIIEGDNYQTAKSLHSMLDKLIQYRCKILHEEFQSQHSPFKKIDTYPKLNCYDVFFEGIEKVHAKIKVDMECKLDKTDLHFWINDGNEASHTRKLLQILEKIELKNDFTAGADKKTGRYIKSFNFPGKESELREYVKDMLKKLDKYQQELP